jgi:uncharacterized phage-like protein YoqJ
MKTFIITCLATNRSFNIEAINKYAALEISRKQSDIQFYTIDSFEHKTNRWNINRGYA